MTLEMLKQTLPECAKDIKLNLSTVFTVDPSVGLSHALIAGIALASAYATKNNTLISVLLDEYEDVLNEKEKEASKGASILMAMNNVYYRYVHLVSDPELKKMPAKLRMNFITQHGIPSIDFELYSLAVSAINGCGMCMDAHTRELVKKGVSKRAIQTAVRIAAVINGLNLGINE